MGLQWRINAPQRRLLRIHILGGQILAVHKLQVQITALIAPVQVVTQLHATLQVFRCLNILILHQLILHVRTQRMSAGVRRCHRGVARIVVLVRVGGGVAVLGAGQHPAVGLVELVLHLLISHSYSFFVFVRMLLNAV